MTPEDPAEDDSSASGCDDIEDKTVVDAVDKIDDLFGRLWLKSEKDFYPVGKRLGLKLSRRTCTC